jgi:serine/threonine protein kinase
VATWSDPIPVAELRGGDLGKGGVVFASDGSVYRTTGEHLNDGGMGSVYFLERQGADGHTIEPVVGKIFHQNYLYQLRTDDVTRRDHATTLNAMALIKTTQHPHLLPTYSFTPIADNHIFITPRKAETLLETVAKNEATTRRKVELLMQAIRALGALHEQRIVHRDFTLRNILVDGQLRHAYLFDFDLALSLDEIGPVTYRTHYRGRIFGSPGFSVAPESLDPALMESAITHRLDIFAIGAALYGLFTDETVYGNTQDMWGLLVSIADGVVVGGNTRLTYKETVPPLIRPVIERCLERDPGNRAGSVSSVLSELDGILDRLDDGRRDSSTFHSTLSVRLQQSALGDRLADVMNTRTDKSVNAAVIQIADDALARHGYQIDKSLGRVKGHPIFLASPKPELLAHGRFSDTNTFPKIVTAQNLNLAPDPQVVLDGWFGHYLPILKNAREGLMTTLYRAVFDEESYHLLLFSEFVNDARFGPDLDAHDLTLEEAFGLGFLVTQQVARLHAQGLAHNNVRARSLLLKGLRETRDVHPAMLGLVEPSMKPDAVIADVCQLAGLVLSWIRPIRVEALDQRHRVRIDEIRNHMAALAFDQNVMPQGIDELIQLLADAMSVLNFNFGVLRDNLGDLDDYALMLVSHPLYGRLWE